MPWRKQTLTPFRSSSPTCRTSDSGAESHAEGFSAHGIFGGSDFELSRNLLEPQDVSNEASEPIGHEPQQASSFKPVLSKQQFDNFLGHAFLSVAQWTEIKMPWEKGIFAQIFGDELPAPQFSMPCPNLASTEIDPSRTVQDLVTAPSSTDLSFDMIFPHAISCLSDMDHQCRHLELSRRACDKWLSILAVNLEASEVGRNLLSLGDLDSHRVEAHEIISAVIGVRSHNTAITRANSLLKFVRFVLEESPNISNPFQEDLVWRYFHFLKHSGGATTAASTLSAFRYAKHIMGFSCLEVVLNSRRLKGYSEVLYSCKRKLQQALTLSVWQVKCLHLKLEDAESNEFDRAAAGFMLAAIYGRCRASDFSFLDHIKHDHNRNEGFVEFFTSVHKTGRSAAKKSILLPILAPAIGITGNNWAEIALDVFATGWASV